MQNCILQHFGGPHKTIICIALSLLISTAFRPLASLSTLRDHEIVWGALERRQGARGAVRCRC